MSLENLRARFQLLRQTPFPLVLDKFGLMRHPYRVSTGDGVTVELRPGVRGERYIFYEVFMKSSYLSAGQRIRPGDTVVDVGANVGFFSILAASLVGPTGWVVALEPQPDTFNQLQRNIQISGMKNIRARQVAVSERKGIGMLFFGDVPIFSSLFSSVDDKPTQLRSQEVSTSTLEDILEEESVGKCNYLKLDCEGAEYAILNSLSPAVASRIEQITMEVHNIPGRNPAELDARLCELGFRAQTRGKVSSYVRA